jgi:hypothetical protein
MAEHSRELAELLLAPGPAPDRAEKMGLYSWLIGSWDVDVSEFLDNGSVRRRPGKWNFGWVLEGRAIQDVWVVPPPGARYGDAVENLNYCGATLRVYDPRIDAWRLYYADPVSQIYLPMVGRRQGDEIVQEGTRDGGALARWIFYDIHERSFRWRGEFSFDGGATWRVLADFSATRAD